MNAEVRLSPHGLQFITQPTLTLDHGHCGDHFYRLAYVDESDEVLEWPISYDDQRTGKLYGWIWHFSRYLAAFSPLRGYTPSGG